MDGINAGSRCGTMADVEAFHLIQRFRIARQLEARNPNLANRVNPSALNELHRLMLKEALKVAKRMQSRLQRDLGPAVFH